MKLRAGYPVFHVDGITGIITEARIEPGWSLTNADWVVPPAGVRLPMPVNAPQEWLAGTLCDERGPFACYVYVPAAAIDPHS